MRPLHLAPATLLLCACGDAGPAGTAGATATTGDPTATTTATTGGGALLDLVDPAAWLSVPAADDPFAAHRPPAIDCPANLGWLIEKDSIEIDTGACNYAGLVQPSLHAVARGDTLRAFLYHFDLLAAAPATAHLAVTLGGDVIFDREIAIPGPAAVFDVALAAPADAPAGAPVVFHLHNHGQNTWTFARLQVEAPGP